MNKVCITIDKCCDCQHHYVQRIYTADSWEHVEGLYCSKVTDVRSSNQKHRLVVSDDWDAREHSRIPDWCPLLNKNKHGGSYDIPQLVVDNSPERVHELERKLKEANETLTRTYAIIGKFVEDPNPFGMERLNKEET